MSRSAKRLSWRLSMGLGRLPLVPCPAASAAGRSNAVTTARVDRAGNHRWIRLMTVLANGVNGEGRLA